VSGIHYPADHSISVSNAAWMHYGDALHSLKKTMTRFEELGSEEIISLCFATTFLCIIEVYSRLLCEIY
jgi:hypothetical protein